MMGYKYIIIIIIIVIIIIIIIVIIIIIIIIYLLFQRSTRVDIELVKLPLMFTINVD